MSWLSRSRFRGEMLGPQALVTGIHRSPGLAALCRQLDRHKPRAILDLGASSTENLRFLIRYCDNVAVENLARSRSAVAGKTVAEAARSTPFRLGDVESLALPEDGDFDVVLMWDLLHYFERSQLARFMVRLAGLCRRGALVLLLASSTTPITPVPLYFRIEGRDRLFYGVPTEPPLPAPHFTPGEVEGLMCGFRPLRLFQLRNGLQEFLFSYEG
ncbi:MAG: class I SAM-dependent methyltransferase [bacterium]|nr:class I SAM-dependent methyltransferase [bacterium]